MLIRSKYLILASLLAFVFGGICFVLLSSKPFGSLFWGSFYLLVTGFSLTMIFSGFKLFKQPGKWKKTSGALIITAAFIFLTIFSLFKIDFRLLIYGRIPTQISKEQWLEDLRFLAAEMPTRHPDLFSLVPSKTFNNAIKNFEQKLPELTENQIILGFMKILALPDDGHTTMFPFPTLSLHFFPIKTYCFSDGWYITDASREFDDIIGSRIVKIGSTDIEIVFDKFKSIIGAENDLHKKMRFQMWGFVAELLEAEGIIPDAKKASFVLEKENGKQYEIEMKAEPALNWAYWYLFRRVEKERSPAVSNFRKNNYWFEFREDSRTIYFQFNEIGNQSADDTIIEFTERLRDFVNTHEFDRFIVDIRNNIGGNSFFANPLIELLSSNPKINRRGRLFTLIGRKTYSAAINFATMLENKSKTLFVGESTGEGPNQFGDHLKVKLPNSEISVLISSRYWQYTMPEDSRQWIAADIPVTYSHSDFVMGRDPAIEAILNFKIDKNKFVELDRNQLKKFTGQFLFSPYQILSIAQNENGLFLKITDSNHHGRSMVESELYAISPTTFLTDIKEVKITFQLNRQDSIKYLILNWKGNERSLEYADKDFVLPLDLIKLGQIAEGVKRFAQISSRIQLPSNLELNINSAGYRYLRQEKFQQAAQIFKLNADLFPKSANTYDSLGEAHMMNGDNELAIRNYQKSLELNPDNSNAAEMIEKLRAQQN